MSPSDILILRTIVNAAPPGYDTLRAHAVLDRAGDDAKELERRRDFMGHEGYRRCDIPACNCGSWHGGDAHTRLHEIYEELGEETQGKTALTAVATMRTELERLRAVIRETHKTYCEPEPRWRNADARHAPECLLYEVEP